MGRECPDKTNVETVESTRAGEGVEERVSSNYVIEPTATRPFDLNRHK